MAGPQTSAGSLSSTTSNASARASASHDSSSANVGVVKTAITALEDLPSVPSALHRHWSPDFRWTCNGRHYDFAGFVAVWKERQEQLQEARIQVLDIFGKGDQVAAVRCASVTTRAGAAQPRILVVDVWHVAGGQIVEGEQVWQRMRGPAGDDLPLTAREGEMSELVRAALGSLADLASVQDSLRRYWAPGYVAHVDGVRMDFDTLCQHWAALQDVLSIVTVYIGDMVVHGGMHGRGGVGVAYRLLVTRKACGRRCELHLLGVFGISGGQITSCEAVSRVVSGSPEDEQLTTLLPASP